MVAAIAGAVTAVPPAWSAPGLPEAATRWYVLDRIKNTVDPMLQTESKLLVAQAQQQQTLNLILLSQLQSSLYAAKKDMAASPSDTVQARIEDLQRQIQALQMQAGSSR